LAIFLAPVFTNGFVDQAKQFRKAGRFVHREYHPER
jgi:hypothetical protein